MEILSSMLDGSVPPSLIQTVYVCLALVLVVGMAGLLVAEASRWYLVGLVFFVAGFFISFSWYEPSLFPSLSLSSPRWSRLLRRWLLHVLLMVRTSLSLSLPLFCSLFFSLCQCLFRYISEAQLLNTHRQ